MNDYIVLDTDVASSIYKIRQLPVHIREVVTGIPTAITFATIGEMTKWAQKAKWGPAAQEDLGRWLSKHHWIDGTEEVAHCWGHLAAAEEDRGRRSEQNDTWIAACCIVEGLPLATLNRRDFVGFADHHGLDLVGEQRGKEE